MATVTAPFQAKVGYATDPSPVSVAMADISGDSKPDLVVGRQGQHARSLHVLWERMRWLDAHVKNVKLHLAPG